MKTHTMDKTWFKYDYLCTDCDALTEVTTVKNLDNYRGWCSCGSANIIQINKQDVTQLTHV
jgi:hypothetical protein